MKILERRLCRLGKGRGFYIPEKYMTDEQIDEVFDLIVTPHKIPPIRSQVLNLLSDGNSWTIQDLAAQSCQHVNQDAHVIYEFIEAILDTVPEITKVGDARYRLLIA
jgi:hypothetical protein